MLFQGVMMLFKFLIWEQATTRVAPYYTPRYIVGCDPCGRPLGFRLPLYLLKQHN